MALLSPLLLASTLFMAGVENPVYLAKFDNKQQEIQTRISFHHALLTDEKNGILLQLTNDEVLKLQSKGITLSAADDLWQRKARELSYQQTSLNIQQAGIPGFPCYSTVEETFAQLQMLLEQYPDLTDWQDIGDSWQKENGGEGYDLNVLKIGNKNLVNPPVLFIQSGLHARELATAGLTLDFAKLLLEDAKVDADIAWILDRHQIHILFQSNPDGRKIAEKGFLHRKNNNENHCANGNVGVDLNRNYSFGWNSVSGGSSGQACQETYRGPSAGSEPEVAAIENYVRSLYPDVRGPNDSDAAPETTPGLYLDIHSYSRLILWPWGHTNAPAPNQAGLEALGKKLAYFNKYMPQQSIGLYATDGTSDNLAYGELGVAHITFELGTEFFQSCSYYDTVLKPDNIEALLYAAKVVEAPYLLSQGPDIESIEGLSTENGQIRIQARATEERFSRLNGNLATDNIAQVHFSLNAYPEADNTRIAEISDGSADSPTENAIITFDETDLIDGQVTLYVQAKDSGGQVGPVSAFKVDTRLPELNAQVECTGAKCAFKTGNSLGGFSYLWRLSDSDSRTEAEFLAVMPQIGVNKVTYQLTNQFGVTQSKELDVLVDQLFEPVADYSESCQEYVCQFDGALSTDEDSLGLNYEWKINAKVESEAASFSHDFSQAGTYDVQLKVTDEHGQISLKETQVVLTAPVVIVEPPVVVEPPEKKSGGSFGWLALGFLAVFSRLRK
ncbi:hypothetical protein PULV_a3426 [Pseudoalteromonas ulvae UL12]|uniref:M14 family zinc carboxypeptidase n=1 Tax=Pseudoalteromonas ulvae TaxID=107327 RepID=UPI00186B9653|nr:M14 family zinc carboxypeptidase [Pseudoalteromonas ulvae]MBE0365111.1 hypothetical protein [Pseudoalteromonas ulvae UL12]